jgi:hypothetical protein
MRTYLPPLMVHVVSAATSDDGRQWAHDIQKWLGGDVAHYTVPEPNLPVLLWGGAAASSAAKAAAFGLPPDIRWKEAARTALLVLADQEMVASAAWRAWCARQAEGKRKRDLLLCCTTSPEFSNLGAAFGDHNAIRLDRVPALERGGTLRLLATHALARWYSKTHGGRIRLFVSHAKHKTGFVGGRDLALKLKEFIDARPVGERFFDEVDITGGEEFEHVLKTAISNSAVIVLLTDAFSSRFWCGLEAVAAKQLNRPVVVVDALEHGEPASLAYLGKNPTVRWDIAAGKLDDRQIHERIVATALLEQLRLAHDKERLSEIREIALLEREHVTIAARPVELATLPEFSPRRKRTIFLHSDPPTPRYELELIRRIRPDVMPASATQALAGCYAGTQLLTGRRIAISISDPPEEERARQGMNKISQERFWTHLATHLIAAGASIAYGGDLRTGGYTDQLMDLASVLADAGRPMPSGVVHWYVGWPFTEKLTPAELERIPGAFSLHQVALPAKAGSADPAWAATDPEPSHRFPWTLATRAVRLRMATDCDARVLVGGPFLATSPWPGQFEEFETSLQEGKAVFVVGGFGGVSRLIADLLQGGSPEVFTRAYQDEDGKRTSIREYYEHQVSVRAIPNMPDPDWTRRTTAIRTTGVSGLNNGLTRAENERLFASRSYTEIVALVLKGLAKLAQPTRRTVRRSRSR